MTEIRGFAHVAKVLFLYLLYRLKLRSCPTFQDDKFPILVVLGRILHWNTRLRIVSREHCPSTHPVVFCSNHIKKDDPFIIECAIHRASGALWVDHMMRDDFFGSQFKFWFVDPDELLAMCGAHHISRDRVTPAQIKVYIELLRRPYSFLMFPSGTRSRSGLFMEYRENAEPGGPSFFIAHVQRGEYPYRVPVVPVARCYNPVRKTTAVVFGTPLFLEPGAGRAAQRALDYRIVDAMAALVELNVPQILSAFLYLRCLHGLTAPISLKALDGHLRAILSAVTEYHVDPLALPRLGEELDLTLRYFEKRGMLSVRADEVIPDAAAILNCPEVGKDFREKHPIRFLMNQIIHLPAATQAIESRVLHEMDH